MLLVPGYVHASLLPLGEGQDEGWRPQANATRRLPDPRCPGLAVVAAPMDNIGAKAVHREAMRLAAHPILPLDAKHFIGHPPAPAVGSSRFAIEQRKLGASGQAAILRIVDRHLTERCVDINDLSRDRVVKVCASQLPGLGMAE